MLTRSEPSPLRAPVRHHTISQVSSLCRLTPRAIRIYEERRLIAPERDANGVRLYCDADVEVLFQIAQARRAGLSIAEIAELLSVGREAGPVAQALRLADLCRARVGQLETQRRELNRLADEALAFAGRTAA